MVKKRTTAREPLPAYNVAEAKKRLSELIGRVAYGKASFLITRRGKPMARLVAADDEEHLSHLGEVQGWLDEDDPFFSVIDETVADRARHVPRARSMPMAKAKPASRRKTVR